MIDIRSEQVISFAGIRILVHIDGMSHLPSPDLRVNV